MKKRLLPLLLVGLMGSLTPFVQADLVVVQQIEGASGADENHKITMKIKGDKVRVDIEEQMSVIINTTTNDSTTLLHGEKMFMTASGETMKQAIAATKDDTPEQYKSLGKFEEIDGHKTELYSASYGMNGQKLEGTYWIAKEFPNGAKFLEVMKTLENSAFGQMAKQPKDIPGVPVKSVTKMPTGGSITTKLVSITEENVDEAAFAKPTDYKEFAMPSLPVPAAPAAP